MFITAFTLLPKQCTNIHIQILNPHIIDGKMKDIENIFLAKHYYNCTGGQSFISSIWFCIQRYLFLFYFLFAHLVCIGKNVLCTADQQLCYLVMHTGQLLQGALWRHLLQTKLWQRLLSSVFLSIQGLLICLFLCFFICPFSFLFSFLFSLLFSLLFCFLLCSFSLFLAFSFSCCSPLPVSWCWFLPNHLDHIHKNDNYESFYKCVICLYL